MAKKSDPLQKMYYDIGDVSALLDLPQSTLRFWETQFADARPHRSPTGRRLYTPDDLNRLQLIVYLLRDRGLKIEAAKEALRTNRDGVSKKAAAIGRLRRVRDQLQTMLDALNSLR